MTPPAYPTDGSRFGLTDGLTVGNFEGSLILWSARATPPLIQAISDASVGGRVAKGETLSFLAETYLPVRQSKVDAETALAVVEARIAKAEAVGFSDPEVKAEARLVAEQWFDARLTELSDGGSISAASRTHATTMFGAYCDAKLWELAASPLAGQAFLERPTPNQMCEPYYASRGYFADEALCGPAPGKRYFDCLWKDGVVKSTLFIAELETKTCPGTGDVFPNRKVAIEAWLASGLLAAILSDESAFETTTYAAKMASYILAANENISSSGVPAKAAYADLKRCRSAFRRDFAFAADRWEAASPYTLRDIAETELIDVPATTYKLLPPSGRPETDRANYEKLAKYVRAFGKRFQPVTAEPAASYSDYLFNHKADGTTLEANGKASECEVLGKDFRASCPNATDPAFRRFAELKRLIVPASDVAERQRLANLLQTAAAGVVQSEQDYKDHLAKVKQETVAGVAAVNAPGATVYFNAFGVKLLKGTTGTGGMTVLFQVKEAARGFVGCLPETAGATCTVPAPLAEEHDLVEHLDFDAEQGKLTVRARLTAPESSGFAAKVRETESGELRQSFNDVDVEVLAGQLLEVTMYANRLGHALDFFTGDAKILIEDAALTKELFTGSVSGDNFPEAQQRLLGAAAAP